MACGASSSVTQGASSATRSTGPWCYPRQAPVVPQHGGHRGPCAGFRHSAKLPRSRHTDCDDWLAAVVAPLDDQRALLNVLLATHLPSARQRPLEASFLVLLDLRAHGHGDPAAIAAPTRAYPRLGWSRLPPRPRWSDAREHRYVLGPPDRDHPMPRGGAHRQLTPTSDQLRASLDRNITDWR